MAKMSDALLEDHPHRGIPNESCGLCHPLSPARTEPMTVPPSDVGAPAPARPGQGGIR